MISVRPLATALVGALFGVALALGATTSASAHDGLIAASPAADSTVSTEVSEVSLEFSQDFLDVGGLATAFAVQVVGPDGRFYNTGCVTLGTSRITTAAEMGESGQYQVLWQIVSSDGHPTSDTYVFNYERPESVTSAEGAATGETCEPAAAPEPVATKSTAPVTPPAEAENDAEESTSEGDSLLPLAIGAAAAVGAIVVVTVLIARTRRKP